ncbi:MAG: DUF1489 domain-containing protein [Xanthobacteraceae bacterium]|nr:DUF1489 domain-containing protein [Xanthobacteraceae bacterium]QYK43816.1 MAG: DUF1489 domain-containing protein [Xanthobacteraceae bacterium]
MALHLIKLCVGVDSIRELDEWIAERMAQKKKKKEALEHIHVTRMMPSRGEDVLDGGSLYWVIKGMVSCRQRILDLRTTTDKEGTKRCRIVMEPKLIPVMPRPHRPFQGWRYLKDEEAPADLKKGQKGAAELPEEMRRQLRELGLL